MNGLSELRRVCFVGDVHLGDGAWNDGFGRKDELLLELLARCPEDYEAVVFMGDLLDPPQAFGLRRIGRAHARVLEGLERLCRRMRVFVVPGNHDWRVDYEGLFPGIVRRERLLVGNTLVWHGHQLDALCSPEHRLHATAIALHHLAERCFRFRFRVPLFDYDTWQNRVAHWLGHKYGAYLRIKARLCRRLGAPSWAEPCETFIDYWSRSVWGDANALFGPIAVQLREGTQETMVCGHTHVPGQLELSGRRYVNAGSWAGEAACVAVLDGDEFEVTDLGTQCVHRAEGLQGLLSEQHAGDFFAWWALHYRGWLRFRRPSVQ
jgi:UDP-2,3-diacylglucosamine pyrophosphatase LpxH